MMTTDSLNGDENQGDIVIRHPTVDDGGDMWQLASDTSLDLNSSYSYLMMAEMFSDTCAVAILDGKLVGFVTGFEFKNTPDTLFIWQVAVEKENRKDNVAARMIHFLMEEKRCTYLHANITQANRASISLFRGIAESYDTRFTSSKGFTEDDFPDDHDAEMLVEIGPVTYEDRDEKYLIVKRGFYWRPQSAGYTGLKDDAGRFTQEEAYQRTKDNDGTYSVKESDAETFSPQCDIHVKIDYIEKVLRKKNILEDQ